MSYLSLPVYISPSALCSNTKQLLHYVLCVSQHWYDHYLQWNQSEYPGVKNLRFTPDQVWTPDILLYNRYVTCHHTHTCIVAPAEL